MTSAIWATTVVLDCSFALLVAARLMTDGPASRTAVIARRTAALAFCAALVDLVLRSREMADVPWSAVPAALPSVLRDSRIGHFWLVDAVAIAVVWVTVGRVERWRWATLAALVGWAAGRSAVTHAASDGAGWPVAVQGMHEIAMGAWTGSVWLAASNAWWPPGGSDATAPAARGKAVHRLSTLATWALATVVATGVISARRHLGSVAALTADDAYAGWLRIKLACVAVAVGFGAANRWHTLPPLLAGWRDADPQVGRWERRFRWLLRLESVALLAAIAIAAKLGSTEPPSLAP